MENLSIFRKIAFWEGVSALLLFFFAMPMKYGYGNALWVKIFGNLHGFLVIAYLVFMLVVGSKYKWSASMYVICVLAAIFPFGTFILDAKFLKPLSKK